jgi:hypothetical protein
MVVVDENFGSFTYRFDMNNKYDGQLVTGNVIVCPNKDCREYIFVLWITNAPWDENKRGYIEGAVPHHRWRLIPESRVQVFPSYIRPALLDDYQEACLICDKSPKASATLSRRCLQGMIRDFWGVTKGRLVDEIEAIKNKVDQTTWEAIDSLRRLGNIGAHMEKDINLIVDVDPGEASLLIELLETLFAEWYIARHDRDERMNKIKLMATSKDAAKKGGTGTP